MLPIDLLLHVFGYVALFCLADPVESRDEHRADAGGPGHGRARAGPSYSGQHF